MKKDKVLWADDEIDLLKPHILFLKEKGYEVVPVISGQDAIDRCREDVFDIIGCHGDEERRGEHHEPSHWQQDCRLLD